MTSAPERPDRPAIVADASSTVAWLLSPAENGRKRPGMDLSPYHLVVPVHWRFEAGGALLAQRRRARLSLESFQLVWARFSALEPEIDLVSLERWREIGTLAQKTGLTLDDSAYVDLAIRRNLPLATLDVAMRQAAARLGVSVRQ